MAREHEEQLSMNDRRPARVAIAAPVMWRVTGHWLGGLLFGGIIGLIVGVLLSGGFLMIYRFFKH